MADTDSIRSFVVQTQTSPPPPVHLLAPSAEVGDLASDFPRQASGYDVSVTTQPGGFGVRLRSHEPFMNARNPGQGIIERVLVLAGRVDKRSIATVDGALADEAIAVREFLTSVDDIPVVGPGGRITFYTNQGGFTVDISVRRRTGRVDGNWSWRDPDLITAAWSRLSEGRLIESRIEFGYFEAGLHDVQLLLRPAYMFTATYQSTASRRGGWRTVIVEPATSARETSDDAGLETWFVEEI